MCKKSAVAGTIQIKVQYWKPNFQTYIMPKNSRLNNEKYDDENSERYSNTIQSLKRAKKVLET